MLFFLIFNVSLISFVDCCELHFSVLKKDSTWK